MLIPNKSELSQLELASITAKAISIFERIESNLFEVDMTQNSEQNFTDKRLERWCEIVADGNWEKFYKRLNLAGWNIDRLRAAMGEIKAVDVTVLPSWSATLKEILNTAQNKLKFGDIIPIDSSQPLPFEDLLLPACFVARQKLETRLGLSCLEFDLSHYSCLPLELLSKKAYLTMERSLLSRLVGLCEKTLEFEFSRFRPLGESFLNILLKQTKAQSNNTYYKAFVQKMLQDGLLAFFQKYPVLGRLIATQVDYWVEATAEFLQRLKADKSEIEQEFAQVYSAVNIVSQPSGVLGKVVEIKPNLSDPHKGGRCVISLSFESGVKLVYKPRNLGLEVGFNKLLDWCNQQNALLPFKVLKVLNRQNYGWMEYVEQQPCSDEASAKRFYQRAGMLLCLLYALGGNDCHHENLIASGEHLVIIDTETLLHHEPKHLEEFPQAAQMPNQNFWKDSVLRTGLLPCWDINKDKHIAYDVSGLGSVYPQLSPWKLLQWQSVNTDNMHQIYQTVMIPLAKNVPILNEMPLSPNDYLEELIDGFGQMYRFLMKRRQFLLAEPSPLAALFAQQVRFAFRPTKAYGVILEKTLAPEFLRDGVDRSIELDILARIFFRNSEQLRSLPILHSELKASTLR